MDELKEKIETNSETSPRPKEVKLPKPKELEEATLPIGQSQWAVSCADDPFYIFETARLGSCFALIVYETKRKIGAVAHIDKEADFSEVFDKIISLLNKGVDQNYRVVLVNCDFTGVSIIQRGKGLGQVIEQKQKDLEKKRKLKGDFEYVLGEEASFDLKTGDFCPFAISQKTIEAQIKRHRELYAPDAKSAALEYQLIYLTDKFK